MKKVSLDDIKKIETPFKVPDGYFDQLENEIHEKVSTETAHVFAPKWRLALVPALLVVVISGVLVVSNLQKNTGDFSNELLAEVSDEEILTYLAYSDISESEIASLAGDDIPLFTEEINYLEDIELGDEDLDELLDQLETESEYL